ncbi:MAG: oligosaccharide flippase family protein [Bacteroides heparinolyticus]|nr:oligosaccharide flippase family protein [Bacteroides heparinolyticus]
MAVNQLKAGAFLNYIILGLDALVGILYTPFLLRMLGQSEYGLYSLAASIIAYLSMLDLGFGDAVIRYTAKFRAEGKTDEQYEMFGLFIILYSIIGVLTVIVGFVLYFNIDSIFGASLTPIELERSKVLFLLMVSNLAITFPLSIYGAIITAYENFIFLRVIQILRIVLSTVTMIVLLTMGYKAIAMVVVNTIFNIAALLANVFFCKKKIWIKLKFSKPNIPFLKEISIYSFWILLNAIMDKIYWSTGQFILGAVSGTIAVAVYSVAIQLKIMYYSFSTSISGVFLPRVTSMVTKGASREEISNIFIRIGRIQFMVVAFIFCGFVLLGKPFVSLWAGEGYDDVYVICLLFFGTTLIPLIQNLGITILQARNEMKYRSLLILFCSVVSLLVAIPIAKQFGGIGVAVVTATAIMVGHGVLLNIYYRRKQSIDIARFWNEIAGMAVVPIVITSVFYVVLSNFSITTFAGIAIAAVAFSLVYLSLFYRLSMNDSERELITSALAKLKRH